MILGYEIAGAGPVLALVHSFPGDRRIWSEQVAALSHVRRVVAVDLPGRGRSLYADYDPQLWSMDSYADDVAETVQSLGAAQVDLAGISMGGYVLFSFWRRHPQLVRSLIFASTRPTEDPPEGKQGRQNVAALVREKGTLELVPMMFSKLFAPGAGDDVKGKVELMVRDLPPQAAAADSLAMGKRPDSTNDLGSISVPVLVLHGEQDQLVPLDKAREMAARIPGARFVPIARSGHLTPVENPEAVNTAIRDFLKEVSEKNFRQHR